MRLCPPRAIAGVVSLPLCIAVIVLCLISTLHPLRWASTIDYYGSRPDRADYEIHRCIGLGNGVVYLQFVRRGQVVAGMPVHAVAGYTAAYTPVKTLLGFTLARSTTPWWSFREVDLPLWPIAVVSAIAPMRAHLRHRQSRIAGSVACVITISPAT